MTRIRRAIALALVAVVGVSGCRRTETVVTPTDTKRSHRDRDAAAGSESGLQDQTLNATGGCEAADRLRVTSRRREHRGHDLLLTARHPRDAKAALRQAILRANAGLQIRISGHADERGSDQYNDALGQRRAASARRYLSDNGIDGSRIAIVSYGEQRPAMSGADENAWARNRRAEFEITAGGNNIVPPQRSLQQI
jgi:peptidoglycan-associated lipoprotein